MIGDFIALLVNMHSNQLNKVKNQYQFYWIGTLQSITETEIFPKLVQYFNISMISNINELRDIKKGEGQSAFYFLRMRELDSGSLNKVYDLRDKMKCNLIVFYETKNLSAEVNLYKVDHIQFISGSESSASIDIIKRFIRNKASINRRWQRSQSSFVALLSDVNQTQKRQNESKVFNFNQFGAGLVVFGTNYSKKDFLLVRYLDVNHQWVHVQSRVAWVVNSNHYQLLGLQFIAFSHCT